MRQPDCRYCACRPHHLHSCRRRRQKQPCLAKSIFALSLLAVSVPASMAQQNCISLQGSTACPAFSSASISANLTSEYSFLSFVSDAHTFDQQLRSYIATTYSQQKYQNILGCSSLNLTNTTNIYARYTTSVLCNAIVQSSKEPCGLSDADSTPLCASDCADFAISEQLITASPELCGTPGSNANAQIRADFTRCSNPANSLSGSCIEAVQNESDECGFQSNLGGLCAFCATSTLNSTVSCCQNANVESRCQGVELPTTVSVSPLWPSGTSSGAPNATSSGTGAGNSSHSGLSGGAIAGVVIGSLVGAALLITAIILCCFRMRKRKQSQAGSILNTPSPTRHSSRAPMSHGYDGLPPTIVPGARVQRMSALEEPRPSESRSDLAGGVMMAAFDSSPSYAYSAPGSVRDRLESAPPKRGGSLTSNSVLGSSTTSPQTASDGRQFSSPDGVASGQSEQLQFFKDYYSQDDIRPGDTVATLWAYQPRAGDEFELDRGDLLKIVGIWDDGWATGIRLNESAEQWEARRSEQRDSGVSNTGSRSPGSTDGDIKAFPLVCVCLPQHWRKTIEGDSTDTGGRSGGDRPPPSP